MCHLPPTGKLYVIWEDFIPADIRELYEVKDYRHAAAILANEFPQEFQEICQALLDFRITRDDIRKPGGNESDIPKKFSAILRPLGWVEKQMKAKMVADEVEVHQDTHKVDYLKGRVAFDLEWNSKDQTYDRDLFAFRTFFDYDRISVGVLVTRSNDLDPLFNEMGDKIKKKYGASTTHMNKLLPRLRAGRNGGCPVLVFGITQQLVEGE